MKIKNLTKDQSSLLQRLAFERDGFRVLMKEFMIDSPLDTSYSVSAKEWADLKYDYLASNNILLMAVNEIAEDQNAALTFSIDFNEGVLKW